MASRSKHRRKAPLHRRSGLDLVGSLRLVTASIAVLAVAAIGTVGFNGGGAPSIAAENSFSAPVAVASPSGGSLDGDAVGEPVESIDAPEAISIPIDEAPAEAPAEASVESPAVEETVADEKPISDGANAPPVETSPSSGIGIMALGDGVLTLTMEPVDHLTGAPQTWAGSTGLNASTKLAYRVSYSCSTDECRDTVLQVSPGPLDPTYATYRHLTYDSWTAPFIGATLGGDDTTGRTVNLGNLGAGASGSFTIVYNWAMLGGAHPATMVPAQFFPNGTTLEMSVSGTSSTISNTPVADAAPVEWRSTILNPSVGISNAGNQKADTVVNYQVLMNSGCLPVRDSAPKGDSRYTCAKSYEVTFQLDPRATFQSATQSGTYDPSTHSVTWTRSPAAGLGEPAAGWYAPGNSSVHSARVVSVTYPAAAFSPSGTDDNYCNFNESVTSSLSMRMVYLGSGGMLDDSNVREVNTSRSHSLSCSEPFGKAVFNSKQSTFDGTSRLGNGSSPVVVYPGNTHMWTVSVGNQANVPGVAIIEEPNLAVEGTRPLRIQATSQNGTQLNDATIAWELNTGATGTSAGVAEAPAGTWFVAATLTSGPLAGPNLLSTGTAQTYFQARISYEVAADAPIGEGRTNTATARMTYPDHPSVADVDLGSRSHTLQYVESFGRGTITKTNTGTGNVIPIPLTGSAQRDWVIRVTNTGNTPGVAVVEDLDLGDKPGRITNILVRTSTNNLPVGAVLEYTLNTGATGTANLPFTAPTGTWVTSLRVTTNPIVGANALPTQNNGGSWYEIVLRYQVTPDFVDGSTWTNVASAELTFPGMGLPDLDLGSSTNTVTFGGDSRPRINATFVGAPVVEGGGNPVPGRDVTYQVSGTTSNVSETESFEPQYAFIAPANWAVKPGSASFDEDAVPAGVSFDYKTVTISGVERSMVLATWPAGTTFGMNDSLPTMTVIAQPSPTALAGSSGVAIARIGEASHNYTTAEAVFTTAVVDSSDIDGDGDTAEGFATTNSSALTVGSAASMDVIKEICSPSPDGCVWLSDPSTPVGVDPNATDIEYRLTIRNTGNTTLSNVVGYDVLPYIGDTGTSDGTAGNPRGSTFRETIDSVSGISAGMTVTYSASTNPPRSEVYSGATSGSWGSTASGAQALRMSHPGNLAPGAAVSMRYTANVVGNPPNGAIACNSLAVRVTGIGTVSEPAPVCAQVNESDLALELPGSVEFQVGRPAVVTLLAENLGGATASPATVTIDVPAGLRVTDLAPAGWDCVPTPLGAAPVNGPATLACAANDDVVQGAPTALGLAVIPTATNVCIDASIAGPSFDSEPSNNAASQCYSAAAAAATGVSVLKSDGTSTAQVGDTLTYTITVENDLLFEGLTDVVISDELPEGLEFLYASDGGHLDSDGVTVMWELGALAADASATVTVTVRVTDVIANQFVNRVTVSAPDPAFADQTLSDEGTDTNQLASLTLVKSGTIAEEVPMPGDEIEFEFVITNNGGATLTGITATDALPGVSSVVFGSWPGTAGTLAPGQSVTGTATYALTQDDINAGAVTNTASASGSTGDSKTVTVTDSVDVEVAQESTITLGKSGSKSGNRAGDQVTYTFVVTNTGNVTLTGVTVADELPGLSEISYGAWPSGTEGELGAGQSVTATALYSPSQVDVDSGEVNNTASVTGTSVLGPVDPGEGSATVGFTEQGRLDFEKTASLSGSTITYTFTVENIGNVTLTGVEIADALEGLSAIGYTWPAEDGELAPGDVLVATATYTVKQDDIDAGSVQNTAEVSGLTPSGDDVSDDADAEVTFVRSPNMTFVKTVSGAAAVGSVLTYEFEVENTGNVTLSDLEIVDAMAGLSALTFDWPGDEGELLPAHSVTATATYTVTQSDVDRGFVTNDATATASAPTGVDLERDADATVTFTQNPQIDLRKSAVLPDGSIGEVGETITYSFRVENTGNVTLTDVELTDALPNLSALDIEWPDDAGELAPGAVMTATATYVITQDDFDAEVVENTAEVTAMFDGDEVSDSDTVEVRFVQDPRIEIRKTGALPGGSTGAVGDVVTFSFEVENIGNVSLSDVVLSDAMDGLSALNITWPAAEGELAPAQIATATASYTLTQVDMDRGFVVNDAEVSAVFDGDEISDTTTTTVTLVQTPRVVLEKDAALPAASTGAVGDVVTFSFTVTNGGNVTLTEVALVDEMGGLSALEFTWPATPGELAPGESMTATAAYTLVQDDVDHGSVTNDAIVTAEFAGGEYDSSDSATVTFVQTPILGFEKTGALPVESTGFAGDMVTFSFTATNDGNVTLTDVEIVDEMTGLSALEVIWPGTPGELAPGESATATATYQVTVADMDRGSIVNDATATAVFDGDELSRSAEDTVTFVQSPAFNITKEVELPSGETGVLGDELVYTFEVENTGNVTITNLVIADPMPGLSVLGYTWPGTAGELAPGQTVTARATYMVSQADVDNGVVSNTATAMGDFGAQDLRDTASVEVTILQNPELTITKTADAEAGATGVAGDVLTYEFVVENSGDVTITNVVITDLLPGLSVIDYTWPGDESELAPGQFMTATATYTITQDDVDAGGVVNTATVTGLFDGDTVEDEDTFTVETPFDSELLFSKTVEAVSTEAAQVGDVVEFGFAVTNNGVVTLHDVVIEDHLGGVSAINYSWPGDTGSLAPGEFVTGTAEYALTQADIDAGVVVNTATASGLTPRDEELTVDDSATAALVQAPAATFEKTAEVTHDGWWKAGHVATFTFAVVNTGNVTITDVAISDPMVGLSPIEYQWPGTEGELAPGATLIATATYAITTADLHAGELTNAASLRALAGALEEVSGYASVTLEAIPAPPAGGLAFTGAVVGGTGAAAAALLTLGLLLLILAKRRKREQETETA